MGCRELLLRASEGVQHLVLDCYAGVDIRKLARESECFVTDILSDTNGVSLHRFQIAVWTLVLGIVFVAQVFRDLSMPTFDDTSSYSP